MCVCIYIYKKFEGEFRHNHIQHIIHHVGSYFGLLHDGWPVGVHLLYLNFQAEQRSSTVGLGNKLPGYTALAGESYKDCVKKMMYARYQELTEKENSN